MTRNRVLPCSCQCFALVPVQGAGNCLLTMMESVWETSYIASTDAELQRFCHLSDLGVTPPSRLASLSGQRSKYPSAKVGEISDTMA